MSAEWYYGQNGQRGGPVDLAALQEMARSGRLSPDDLVWRAGMPNWQAASGVAEVASSFAPRAPQPHAAYSQPQGQQGYPPPQGYPPAQQSYPPVQGQQPYQPPYQGGQPQQQGPTQFGPQPGYPQHGGYAPMPMENSNATTAMVLGILSLAVFCLPLGIPAFLIGMSAKNNPVNRGQAIAGIVLGAISTALMLLWGLGLLIAAAG